MPEPEHGAVDLDACPTADKRGRCRCPSCVACGYRKHTAIHGPIYGGKPGSKPCGHEYKPPAAVRGRGEGEE